MANSNTAIDHGLPDKISLTVILTTDGKCWVAQGLQIDYAAYGKTIDDAKSNFERGLNRTIEECSKLPGAINKFIKPVPNEILEEYLTSKEDFISLAPVDNQCNFLIDFLKKKAA